MFGSTVATVIAYVDGFNLYHGLHDKYGRRYLWLDLGHLVQRLRPSDHVVAVRYFTALVRDDASALARQRTSRAAQGAGCRRLPDGVLCLVLVPEAEDGGDGLVDGGCGVLAA
jgi:hypothetical protein